MKIYPNSRIQLRIDTDGAWDSNNPTIESGELCISSDKLDFKVGTGSAWKQATYYIENNPKVVAIKTTANNAASSASNALSRANQAYSLAQSAAKTSGRTVNIDVLRNAVSNQQPITITAEFLKYYQNTDFILSELGLTHYNEIRINEVNNVRNAVGNIVTFSFYTAEAVVIKSSLFSIAPGERKIMVIAGNDASVSMYDKSDTITIPADCMVECKLINNYMFKFTTTKWS